MACEFRYQHIRNTNPGEAPSSSYIREGEIAVNIAADNERIFLKNTDNEVVSFIPEEEVNKRIDNHTFKSSAITDFVESVENVVNSSTTITNRIKNVVTSAITNDSSVSGAVKSIVSAYTYDKNTIDTKIATHTHASSAVTSMANYSKASAAAAITTGDSLNVAIGKLEKKVDDATAASGVSSVSLGSGTTNGTVTLSVNGTLQDTIYVPGLKGAAFLETGTTTATVARGKHNHVANDITDFSSSVESVVTSSTTVTNRIKNVIASAITSNTNVTSAITNVISSNTAVTSAITNVVSAFTYDKDEIDSKISSHTHASSAVTSMRGYSKPSATSAIATGDTLNQAIGKLEKKVDDAVAGGVSSVSLGSGSTNGNITLTVNGTLQDTIYVPGLEAAAFKKVGSGSSEVAAGDHKHKAADITDFDAAVSGAVKNNTVVKNEIISAVTSSTAFTTLSADVYSISGDVVTISGDVTTLKTFKDFMSGHNTVTTLANIPTTKRLVIATISASSNNLSLSGGTLADGYEMHLIINNSSSSKITVTFPSSGNYVAVVSSIDIAANGVGEANIISDGTKLYVRGA
jgi:hypothetical protein